MEERKKFKIPQVPVRSVTPAPIQEEEKQQGKKLKTEPFVSSIYGKNVKDELTFNGAQFGNSGRQYDIFRDPEHRIIRDDYKDYITFKKEEDESNRQERNNFIEVETRQTQNIKPKDEVIYYEQFDDEEEVQSRVQKKIIEREFEEVSRRDTRMYDEVYEEPTPVVKPEVKTVEKEKPKPVVKKSNKYVAPPLSLLRRGKTVRQGDMSGVMYQRELIDNTLDEFGISGRVVHFTKGPAVTQFEVQLDPGVKVQKVKAISDNIMANLKAKSIRIQAPIPGKSTVGIEVPNQQTDFVLFGDLLQEESFLNDGKPLNVVLGLDLSGKPVYLNIPSMPHCLIGGTTGSGKSVCINSIIASILYKAHPDDVKLILVDPKIIEFSNYEDIPHLATPVITEPKLAAAALRWAVEEMQNRYHLFRTYRCRDYEEYAKICETNPNAKPIPYLVIIIDELADLMMVAGNDVEDYIQRITQKGRASGIHMIVATQRPSVDVIKGTIKTNIPTRIAFHVKTQIDSSIILDHAGAEKLLGNGDMLFNDSVNEQRLQGAYISNDEIGKITDHLRSVSDAEFLFTEADLETKITASDDASGINDEYFEAVARFVVENESASINRIQKTFNIGFNRAQSIVNALQDLGIVSENLGSRARTVEVTMEQLESILADL